MKYKNLLNPTIVMAVFALTTLATIGACKKTNKTSDPPKTLTKSFLYDKVWRNQGSTLVHPLNGNGTYGSIGTWQWLNSADSMQIKYGAVTQIWYFDWSTEHEMQARHGKTGIGILFKDLVW